MRVRLAESFTAMLIHYAILSCSILAFLCLAAAPAAQAQEVIYDSVVLSEGNANGRNSTSSDSGNPNGLNIDSSNGRANLGSAFFRALVPVAPLKYRIAERAASTVVNMEPFSDIIFLAKVRDGVFGYFVNKSWTYAHEGDKGRGVIMWAVCCAYRKPNAM